MSENIQSIANGTYTIGSTNELTFSAGPGIKIDSPSAGTVRIGNDETVLWSGDSGSNYAELSEPITNYEYAEITIVPEGGNAYPICTKFPTSIGSRGITAPHGQANAQLSFVWISVDDTSVSAVRKKTINFNSYTTTATALAATVSASPSVIKEVRGINRISG